MNQRKKKLNYNSPHKSAICVKNGFEFFLIYQITNKFYDALMSISMSLKNIKTYPSREA